MINRTMCRDHGRGGGGRSHRSLGRKFIDVTTLCVSVICGLRVVFSISLSSLSCRCSSAIGDQHNAMKRVKKINTITFGDIAASASAANRRDRDDETRVRERFTCIRNVMFADRRRVFCVCGVRTIVQSVNTTAES